MVKLRKKNKYFDLIEFKPFLSLGANDLGQLPKRSASFTVNFKLPWTTNNKILLDNIGEIDLNGSGNAQKKVTDIYLDIEGIIYKGFLRVEKSVPDRYFEVYFATDLTDWLDEIKGKELTNVNLSQYRHKYNDTEIINSFNNEEGYIYPCINYGYWSNIFQSYGGNAFDDFSTKYNEWFPAVYSKTILSQIFADVGYELDPNSDILKEPRFQSEILPFSNGFFEYKNQDIDDTIAFTSLELGGIALSFGSFTKLDSIFDPSLAGDKYSDNSFLWDNASYSYIVPFDGNYTITLINSRVIQSPSLPIIYYAFVNGVQSADFFADSFDKSFRSIEVSALAGDIIDFRGTLEFASFGSVTDAQIKISFSENLEIPYDGTFSLNSMLPNMKQEQFIKDVIVSYGCYINTDIESKRVKFDLFRNVEGKKLQAKDWTSKIDITNPINVDYTKLSNSYGVTNKFLYKQDESERDLNPAYTPLTDYNSINNLDSLGDGSFIIDNDFVVNEKVIYSSPLGSSTESLVGVDIPDLFNLKLMYIPYAFKEYVLSGSNANDISITKQEIKTPRKASVIRNVDVSDLSYNYYTQVDIGNDTTKAVSNSSSVPFAFFVKDTKKIQNIDNVNYNLSWNNLPQFNTDKGLFSDYYEDQISILNRGDVTKLVFKLEEADLSNIDFSIPIYLNSPKLSGYFLINKIPKLSTLNEPVEVEIIKLP